MNARHLVGVLHSFSMKHNFSGKMDFKELFYFNVANVKRQHVYFGPCETFTMELFANIL